MVPPAQPNARPHKGMVVSLHNYMNKDSWGENSIGNGAKNKSKLKKQPHNPISHASITKEKDSDSNNNFNTAPNSPSPEQEIQNIEPVSLHQSQSLSEYEALEKALKENEERERLIDEEIKKYKDIQENIRIQLLAHKVRDSIARNRKPVRTESPFSISNDIIQNDLVIEEMDISISSSIEQHISIGSISLSKKTGKSRMDNVEVQQPLSPPQLNKPVNSTPDELYSPFLTPANQHPNAREHKKATGANVVPKRPVNPDEPVQPLVPAVKRVMETPESSGKKKKLQIDAVVDKPFLKDSAFRENLAFLSQLENEEFVSEEERKLVALDDPPYPGHCIHNSKELSRTAQRAIYEFLNHSSTSLKEMRLILLNLKEASIEQDGRLTIEQEEFTKILIRRIMMMIESYMTLSDESYTKSLRKEAPVDVSATLPDQYYGNITTLDFSRPDLSHHQLYKVIRHFGSIASIRSKKKAQQFLLTSSRIPTEPILRTCDPAIRDDANATLSEDETDYARRIKALGKLTKKEKRKATLELRKEMLGVVDEATNGVDQMVDQIATDTHISKKTKLDPSSSANEPVCLNLDLPTSSSTPYHEIFVNAWKPKPKPDAVSTQQLTTPLKYVTVLEPAHVARKGIHTRFTNDISRAVDKTKNYVSPIVDNTIAKKSASATVKSTTNSASSVENQNHIKPPVIVIDDDPSPSKTPINKKKVFKVTDVPVIIDDNLTSKPTIVDTHKSKEDTSLKTQENLMQFQPYKAALNSLGLSHTTPLPKPKSATLCSAESSGGICKVKNCNFTHFSDYS